MTGRSGSSSWKTRQTMPSYSTSSSGTKATHRKSVVLQSLPALASELEHDDGWQLVLADYSLKAPNRRSRS